MSLSEKSKAIDLIESAVAQGARQNIACETIGISARTMQRWQKRDTLADQRTGPLEPPKNSLTKVEKQKILEIANSPEYRDMSPAQIVPSLADKGIYVASESSFYKVLREEKMNNHRENVKPPEKRHKPDEFTAKKSDEVWTWDITYLKTNVKGQFYYLYLILDLFSRMIVGAKVYDHELAEYSSIFISETCQKHRVNTEKLVLHSDNGSPMKGSTMISTLEALGIFASFSRPSVSNDNPFSESLFRTMKYRPEYPEQAFESLQDAQKWVDGFVFWYNNIHLHSQIKYVTPSSRYHGEDKIILENRKKVYEAARSRNPERWSRQTRNWDYIESVTLNPDQKQNQKLENLLKAA